MPHRFARPLTALSLFVALGAWAQNNRPGLLVLVDHAATSAEAATVCEQRAPGTGAAIREAYARWAQQHRAAQDGLLQSARQEAEAKAAALGDAGAGFEPFLALFRKASMDKLRQSMQAMDAARLAQFCAGIPAEFDKPEMDFTTLWLHVMSRR
jgi:hypothetical protein